MNRKGFSVSAKNSEYYRYCPGEEQIKISDAICFGRRRGNYHKCAGCQFNDDEKARGSRRNAPAETPTNTTAPASTKTEEQPDPIESIFHVHSIQGIYPETINVETAWRIGQATAQFLRSELRGYDRSRPEKAAVVVGRDMRKSSPELANALIEGITNGGSPVIDVGMIDAAQLYFATNHLTCCGGVQVTAGPRADRYNGFRICGLKGRPISSETGLTQIYKIAKNTKRLSAAQTAEKKQEDLSEAYKKFVRGFLQQAGSRFDEQRPLKVVVDASNGMAGQWFLPLFGEEDWLDIIRLNFDHTGQFIHPPDPRMEKNLDQVRDRCQRSKADLGLCFDGDAGRFVAIDERGEVIRPDLMAAMLSVWMLRDTPGSTVVYDVPSTRAFVEAIRQAGGIPRRERSGPVFMKKAMADAKAVFGGDMGGYLYFRDNWFCESAMIGVAQLFNLLCETGKPVSELLEPLRSYAHSGVRYYQNDQPHKPIDHLADKYSDARIDLLDGMTVQYDRWWFNLCPLNDPQRLRLIVEADNHEFLQARLAEIEPLLGPRIEE